MLGLLVAMALAAEPVVEKGDDSWVIGYVDVSASPDAVMALVKDPELVAKIDGSTKVSATKDGDCVVASNHVDHPIASVDYRTRSCPEGDRVVTITLVDGDMKSFDARWEVEDREGGSRVHYRIRTVASFFVPQFVVDRASMKGTEKMLGKVRDHLEK